MLPVRNRLNQEQQDAVLNTYYNLLEEELKGGIAVFKRYFLSDAANQVDTLLAAVPESSYLRMLGYTAGSA